MNTDDLRLLWDCVTRFHARFFPVDVQPRATQIRLLHEELGELTAAYLTGEGDVLQEATDVLFVAFGMAQCADWRFKDIDFKPFLMGHSTHTCIYRFVEGRSDMDDYLAWIVLAIKADFAHSVDNDQWHAAVTAVIAKNDAKTAANGYRVNDAGKVTKS